MFVKCVKFAILSYDDDANLDMRYKLYLTKQTQIYYLTLNTLPLFLKCQQQLSMWTKPKVYFKHC